MSSTDRSELPEITGENRHPRPEGAAESARLGAVHLAQGSVSAPATILIVDDEIRNRTLLEAMLRPEGYLTVVAAGGEDALASIAERAPDLILLDVKMPGMDGYQVTGLLKANPATSNIPIIMVTAHTDRDARMAGLRAGAEEFLTQPINAIELSLRVRNLLRMKALGDLLQSHAQILEQQVLARTADLQRFRTAMDATADAIMLVNRTTMRIEEANATACVMLGYTREEFFRMGLAPLGMATPEQLAVEYDAVIAGHATNELTETRLRRKDGSLVQVEVHRHALRSGANWIIVSVVRDVTERKLREGRIAYLNRVHAMLSGINTLIVRVLDRDELFRGACRVAVDAGGFRMAMICIVDRRAMTIVPVASAGKSDDLLTAVKRLTSSSALAATTMVARAARENRQIISNDSQNDPQVLLGKQYAECGIRSIAVLPLTVAHEPVGILVLYAGEVELFHAEEMTLLTELAGNIAFAVAHIDRQEKFEKLSRIREVSGEINAAIVHIPERDSLLKEVCRIAVEHGKFELVWIATLDEEKQEVQPVAWTGFSEDAARAVNWASISAAQGTLGEAILTRKPSMRGDIQASLRSSGLRNEALTKGCRSTVCLPLVVADKVAALIVLFAQGVGFFDDEELALLSEVAGNVSFALENIDRQEKLDKLSRIRAVSGEINAAIVRIAERDSLLKDVCRIAAEYGKFGLVWVASIDVGTQAVRPIAWNGFSPAIAHAVNWTSTSRGSSTLAEVIRTRRPAVRNDIEAAGMAGPLREEAVAQGSRSTVCLPFVVDDNLVAVITLFAAGRDFFDADELALLNEVAADISFALESIARREQLDYLAYYDVLTGLANRALFHERLEQSVVNAKEHRHQLALVLLDIERFKTINDTLGRQGGDTLLKALATRMAEYAGDAGRLARIDADHFAIITDAQSGEEMARLIEQRDGEIFGPSFRIGDAELRVSAKFGIALFPDDGVDADTLFRNAEVALKKAKAGGDRYLFYTHTMNARVAEKLSLENQLREALEREEFVLHYQPKVNLASGKLTSAEALIRWNDPRTGLVPPGRFIPVLEETGLIHEVGRWALRKAIADYLRWRATGLPAVRISVNVSPLQLRDRGFIAEIKEVTGISAHAADGLELEITESLVMADVIHSIASLHSIRALGVTIAIDDFGTGFSSLSYLAKLPVDTLKIDRSFVIEMTAGPQGLALVSTIINLAHSLKLNVVAEGVETAEQSSLLRLLRCDEMQGYLFSKPVAAEIFESRFLALAPAA